MACYHPVGAYYREGGGIEFKGGGENRPLSYDVFIACGQCIGCRLERSRVWACRIMHEAQLHDTSCFVTLTYDDVHLPKGGTLVYRDFQLFMKRLRKCYAEDRVRFFMCGEYGSQLGRPHYHACLFGLFFEDRQLFRRGDFPLYRSETLDRLWAKGHASVGAVSFESAAYVARYVCDKVTGDEAAGWYTRVDSETGEVFALEPEFCHMSLKPGIGREWIQRYYRQVNRAGSVVMRGQEMKAPKYYDKVLKYLPDSNFDFIEYKRHMLARLQIREQSPERLADREKVAKARLSLNRREL